MLSAHLGTGSQCWYGCDPAGAVTSDTVETKSFTSQPASLKEGTIFSEITGEGN